MNPALEAKARRTVPPDDTWNALLDCAAKEVFQMMVHSQLTTLTGTVEGPARGDTTAMVGLAGALCGVLSIRCSSRTAESIAGKMLGTTGSVDPREVPDAVAEICNMVAGNFKSKISQLAEKCMLSVPTVIRGEDYEMMTISDGERIIACLGYETQHIWVALCVHP